MCIILQPGMPLDRTVIVKDFETTLNLEKIRLKMYKRTFFGCEIHHPNGSFAKCLERQPRGKRAEARAGDLSPRMLAVDALVDTAKNGEFWKICSMLFLE